MIKYWSCVINEENPFLAETMTLVDTNRSYSSTQYSVNNNESSSFIFIIICTAILRWIPVDLSSSGYKRILSSLFKLNYVNAVSSPATMQVQFILWGLIRDKPFILHCFWNESIFNSFHLGLVVLLVQFYGCIFLWHWLCLPFCRTSSESSLPHD